MFRHSFIFARSFVLGKPSSKRHLRRFIIGASGAVILASSLKTIHGDTQPLNRPPKKTFTARRTASLNFQGPSKDEPSAVFDGIRKGLDKLGKDISDLLNTPGSDHGLSAFEKMSEDIELLSKEIQKFQKSIEALGKDINAPQSDDNKVVHQTLTKHAASFTPDIQSDVIRFDSVVVPRSALFPTITNHII